MSRIIKDLKDQKFGLLKALRPTDERDYGYVVWECICDCGTTLGVSSRSLKSGNKTSCGCANKRRGRKPAISIGKVFRRLTVGREIKTEDSQKWFCKCSCGFAIVASSMDLTSGAVQCCVKCYDEVSKELVFEAEVRELSTPRRLKKKRRKAKARKTPKAKKVVKANKTTEEQIEELSTSRRAKKFKKKRRRSKKTVIVVPPTPKRQYSSELTDIKNNTDFSEFGL